MPYDHLSFIRIWTGFKASKIVTRQQLIGLLTLQNGSKRGRHWGPLFSFVSNLSKSFDSIQFSITWIFFQTESMLKMPVAKQYKDISKISSTNGLLFLTGLLILKVYYFMWSRCNTTLDLKTLSWILFLTAFFKVTKIPIIQYRIEVDSREKFNIVCLPASFNIVSWHWNSLTHWNIKCICHIYW